MATAKLTDRLIQNITNDKTQRVDVWDALVPGLGLRVSRTGKRSWCIMERRQGKLYRTTLGRYPNVSLEEARAEARSRLLLTDKQFAEEREGQQESLTVGALAGAFREQHMAYNRTADQQWRYLERDFLPEFGKLDIRNLEFRAIAKHLQKVSTGYGPHSALNELRVVRRFLGWCVERTYIDQNPALGIKLRTPQQARERVLTDLEIKEVWAAADKLGYPFGTHMQMLLVLGQRRTEVATMRWDEIEGDEWRLSADKTKNGRAHLVHLSPLALRLLQRCPRKGSYVFSTDLGVRPISGFSKAKTKLTQLEADADAGEAAAADWRLHDLRRTVATGMARLRVPHEVISRCLNHSVGGVTAIYNRYAYAGETAEAWRRWAAHLDKLTGGPGAALRLVAPAGV